MMVQYCCFCEYDAKADYKTIEKLFYDYLKHPIAHLAYW